MVVMSQIHFVFIDTKAIGVAKRLQSTSEKISKFLTLNKIYDFQSTLFAES